MQEKQTPTVKVEYKPGKVGIAEGIRRLQAGEKNPNRYAKLANGWVAWTRKAVLQDYIAGLEKKVLELEAEKVASEAVRQ